MMERASAPYKKDQRNPIYRREVKACIEAGWPRDLSRLVASCIANKPRVNYSDK